MKSPVSFSCFRSWMISSAVTGVGGVEASKKLKLKSEVVSKVTSVCWWLESPANDPPSDPPNDPPIDCSILKTSIFAPPIRCRLIWRRPKCKKKNQSFDFSWIETEFFFFKFAVYKTTLSNFFYFLFLIAWFVLRINCFSSVACWSSTSWNMDQLERINSRTSTTSKWCGEDIQMRHWAFARNGAQRSSTCCRRTTKTTTKSKKDKAKFIGNDVSTRR